LRSHSKGFPYCISLKEKKAEIHKTNKPYVNFQGNTCMSARLDLSSSTTSSVLILSSPLPSKSVGTFSGEMFSTDREKYNLRHKLDA
jgi:hypothetical protein